ncbi:uncharacterized protein EHS24_002493 [Apiotrichum porosum]|uniref:Ribosome biogenesis protein NOP53 n=1 Tax=Apiotrichum porosum TaxID=105984 RepID=A0A427XGR1_9TREE|nr:uncharacterized protein EHS24_002493 [Apiotrichum porosum]RSH78038.1 hypothetical protein EHS24_002493 [Apiotrichum porosum]
MRASSSRTAAATPATKPYDRPAKASSSAKSKGKGKATATAPVVDGAANIGAPAQHSQPSRKGKKAWRKNVNVTEVEDALERSRAEERVTGGKIADKKDGDLFTVDTTGDVEVAKKVRTKKPLRSLAILAERSAVPSLASRVAAPKPPKVSVTAAEKARMRRVARRTVDDSTSADVKAVGTATTDAWARAAPQKGLAGGFGDEGVIVHKVKAPITLAKQRAMRFANVRAQDADELPTAGVSYNPAAAAHAALIATALQEEQERLAKEDKEAQEIETLGQVVEGRRANADTEDMVNGMRIGRADGVPLDASDDDDDEAEAEDAFRPKQTKRKTQAQRNKSLRAREAKEAAKHEATRKKMEKHVAAAKAFSKSAEARNKAHAESARQRKAAAEARERAGFTGGEKVGRHRVGKKAVEVQLGEDLAESLRQLKPEGNLFKDRFLSLQRRALLEPRAPVLPKRRTIKTKEYEKHAWKKFK